MATFFSMPKLGLNMTEGVIVNWLVKEGEKVREGDPVLEVETDKATQEVEAPVSGILAKIIRLEGDLVPCNHVMAVITEVGEPLPDAIPTEIAEGVAPTSGLTGGATRSDKTEEKPEPESGSERRISISPSARLLAEELGVDIAEIQPSGSRIKRADVEAAYERIQQESQDGSAVGITVKPMSTIRKKIAEAMNHSARTTARVGLTLEVDATNLIASRNKTLEDGNKVSYNVLLAQKAAIALKEYPYMNAQMKDEEIWEYEEINIGIAVEGERGLIVPVLRSVDKKDIGVLHQEFLQISGRALQGKSTLEDLDGGTFTITNLGGYEIESFLPVINLPECAILGVGAIIMKPIASNGQVVITPRMKLTLAFDHRLVDGAPAAKFFQRLKTLIEQM